MVGGYTPEKIALRRAIGMGYDVSEFIRVILKGRAIPANGPIPPDIAGYDPHSKPRRNSTIRPRRARCWTGSDTRIATATATARCPTASRSFSSAGRRRTSLARQEDEQWKKNMDAIGLRIVFRKDRSQELRKMAREGKMPMRTDGWNADYPDAENFMQLLYGPNVGQENHARFSLPEFDKLYEAAYKLPDSPERTQALRPDDGAGGGVRAVAADGASDRGPSGAAVGAKLQAASGPLRTLAVCRHRTRATGERSLTLQDQSCSVRVANRGDHY